MKYVKWLSTAVVLVLILMLMLAEGYTYGAGILEYKTKEVDISKSSLIEMDSFIKEQMDKAQIPGLAVSMIYDGKAVLEKGYGFSDLNTKKHSDKDTLFGLGPEGKIFTAMAILLLQEKGMISLDNTVETYIPWFKMYYQGKYTVITLGQLLYQTSGIPESKDSSEEYIPEDYIKELTGGNLLYFPGSTFHESRANCRILDMVIQKVTGSSTEEYIKNNIFLPLGMNNTFAADKGKRLSDAARTYKISFKKPLPLNLSGEFSHTADNIFVSNAGDMTRFLLAQLGTNQSEGLTSLIKKSHIPDRSVSPGYDGSSYACGWSAYQDGSGELSQALSGSGYSSFIVLRPGDKAGIAVLANMDTAYTRFIGQGLMNMLVGKQLPKASNDLNKKVDNISVAVFYISVSFLFIVLCFFIKAVVELCKKKRTFKGISNIGLTSFKGYLTTVAFVFISGFCLYELPDVFYQGHSWEWVLVWAPTSFLAAVLSIVITIAVFILYCVFITVFYRPGDKALFPLAVISIASGFGNAVVILIINEVLGRGINRFQIGLMLCFILGIILYIFGQKQVRSKLIDLTNEVVYSKRMELVNKILKSSYQSMEKIKPEVVHSGLVGDTETVGNFAGIFITGLTNLVTVVCCFVYAGMINAYGLMLSLFVTVIAAGLYYFVGRSANRLWEQCRDIQNTFFKYVYHITGGFRELVLHKPKITEFEKDMRVSCETYRDKRREAELKLSNAFITGQLLFTSVIAVVVFVFPLLIKGISSDALRNYVLIFLFANGPVYTILSVIPSMMQIKISWNRIKDLTDQIYSMETRNLESTCTYEKDRHLYMELDGVTFRYENECGETFSVGPINCTFESGQITFITGGNGSGKSTLAKLLTGLYKPENGYIRINGESFSPEALGEKYSVIFSDFYLFEKMYGIDYQKKKGDIEKYLKLLNIDKKLEVMEGVFSTTRLSSGQRKRMALMVSYLEDKPICLFDEWAAEQDPEFKKYFYDVLLPGIKAMGKCIIAITHDDGYFYAADRVIKMDAGNILKDEAAHRPVRTNDMASLRQAGNR